MCASRKSAPASFESFLFRGDPEVRSVYTIPKESGVLGGYRVGVNICSDAFLASEALKLLSSGAFDRQARRTPAPYADRGSGRAGPVRGGQAPAARAGVVRLALLILAALPPAPVIPLSSRPTRRDLRRAGHPSAPLLGPAPPGVPHLLGEGPVRPRRQHQKRGRPARRPPGDPCGDGQQGRGVGQSPAAAGVRARPRGREGKAARLPVRGQFVRRGRWGGGAEPGGAEHEAERGEKRADEGPYGACRRVRPRASVRLPK